MEKITGPAEVDTIYLYVVDVEGEDAIIQLQNFYLDEALKEAKGILRVIDTPSSVSIMEEPDGEFLYTVSSYLNDEEETEYYVEEN